MKNKNKNQSAEPVDSVVAVTYRCNSRCVMCNIWQIKDFPEISPVEYLKLPKTLKDVNISGGEPFLRTDLVEIVKNVKKACPKANINISTNGFLVDTIKTVLPKIKRVEPNIRISISIDGVGQMHEKVRRVPQAWPKVLETVRFCRDELKIKHIKFAFTLNSLNYKHLPMAYEWSRKLGIEFTMAVAHTSEIYFGEDHKMEVDLDFIEQEIKKIIKRLLRSLSPKNWVRAYFINGLLKITRGEKRPLKSFAGEDFFYLDPKGDVYPSVVDNLIMGNITEVKDFGYLWQSEQAQKAREDVRGFENNYWMVCTARTAIKRNPLKVANWIFKSKLPFGR